METCVRVSNHKSQFMDTLCAVHTYLTLLSLLLQPLNCLWHTADFRMEFNPLVTFHHYAVLEYTKISTTTDILFLILTN